MMVVFRLLSLLPLRWMHALGWVMGWLVFYSSRDYRRRLESNAATAGLSPRKWRPAVGAAGQMVAELPRLWLGADVPVTWHGEEHIARALAQGRGIVFLTPHLGCFEITAQAYAQRFGTAGHPLTVLFRPPRKTWLEGLVSAARQRPGLMTAPANLAGVKQLLRSLKAGHCVGLLPDQVPPSTMGLWSPFFGKPAFTMTLAARLAQQSGALVVTAWGERLPRGRGFVVHVSPMADTISGDMSRAVEQINGAMEELILRCPGQYLWGYDRYKSPREGH
jgi:KDO2-lipid IV(A) lauroyltransferase